MDPMSATFFCNERQSHSQTTQDTMYHIHHLLSHIVHMYEALQIMGHLPYQVVSRISSINRIIL